MEIALKIDKFVGWLYRAITKLAGPRTPKTEKLYRFFDNLTLYCAERGALYQYCFDFMIKAWKDLIEAHKEIVRQSKMIRSMMMPWGGKG
jgi:hypothetical protein